MTSEQPEHTQPGTWNAIAAMARNRVIGNQGTIPWRIPEDFRWVKQCTTGQVIVMGRRTFEDLGKPLPRRTNLVLSRTLCAPESVVVLPDVESLLRWSRTAPAPIWIFGGATIYRQTLAYCSDLYMTLVDAEPEGDTFFPEFESEFSTPRLIREGDGYSIYHYARTKEATPTTPAPSS